MFETMRLGQKYSSKEYKEFENDLRIKLFRLQEECREHGLAVLINIAGVTGSGRGEIVNMLTSWLDPKKIQTHTFWHASEDERLRPLSWRYWQKIPAKGEFGVFVGGWYAPMMNRTISDVISLDKLYLIMNKNIEREQNLADNGYIIAKFWLHLDKEEHEKRLEKRIKEKTNIHFTPFEKERDHQYDKLVDLVSKIVPRTDRDFAPWFIIDACDDEFRNVSVANALIQTIENALAKKKAEKTNKKAEMQAIHQGSIPILSTVDLSLSLEKDVYKEKFSQLKTDLYQLTYKAYTLGISSTLVFEGMDAAGKGGSIRRLLSSVDARIARVIPISSPTDEELAHHYLWRFWRHVPLAGRVTVYDRSWYGRVLVERVEGFAKKDEWRRAYSEINSFEEELVDEKNILLKFWLHISSEEQLRRFKERENTEWKKYKITPDDWRNREKTDLYKLAANEMFMRTNTNYAAWHIIPSESKYYARIQVLEIYKKALEDKIAEIEKNIKKNNDETKLDNTVIIEDVIDLKNKKSQKNKKDKKK